MQESESSIPWLNSRNFVVPNRKLPVKFGIFYSFKYDIGKTLQNSFVNYLFSLNFFNYVIFVCVGDLEEDE